MTVSDLMYKTVLGTMTISVIHTASFVQALCVAGTVTEYEDVAPFGTITIASILSTVFVVAVEITNAVSELA